MYALRLKAISTCLVLSFSLVGHADDNKPRAVMGNYTGVSTAASIENEWFKIITEAEGVSIGNDQELKLKDCIGSNLPEFLDDNRDDSLGDESVNPGVIKSRSACSIDWTSLEQEAVSDPLTVCATRGGDQKSVLQVGALRSRNWTSSNFSGRYCRQLSPDGRTLVTHIEASEGGFDTGIELIRENTRVDDIGAGVTIDSNFRLEIAPGSDWWKAGPKLSAVSCTDCPLEVMLGPTWHENYIIENASFTPQERHESILAQGGEILGETIQNGSTYKHYRLKYQDWIQYWAIRQNYRSSGTVDIKPIVDFWRKNGHPNLYMQTMRYVFESSSICGKMTIADLDVKDFE